MEKLSKILIGKDFSEFLEEYTCNNLVYFKYASSTSVDVERSLSSCKTLLYDNRKIYTFENLQKHLII